MNFTDDWRTIEPNVGDVFKVTRKSAFLEKGDIFIVLKKEDPFRFVLFFLKRSRNYNDKNSPTFHVHYLVHIVKL
jgi:hypothetical protein